LFNSAKHGYGAVMDRYTMPKDQRRALMNAVLERRNWLHRLHMRMRAMQWNEGDAAYLATLNAYEAMHKLMKTLDVEPQEAPSNWAKHIGPG
jgi:hypothetical protein